MVSLANNRYPFLVRGLLVIRRFTLQLNLSSFEPSNVGQQN